MTEWRQFLKEEEQQPITVGELKAVVEILASKEDQNQKKGKLKKLGGLALKLGIGMIPVVGGVLASGVEIGDNLASLYQAATNPETISQGKLDNQPWVGLLGIDAGFSRIIDDKVEKEFLNNYIKKYTQGLVTSSPETPLPNFTNALAKYLNQTILKPTNSPMQISKK